jgi:thiamine-phosphate pyrophosphorylase
MTAHWRGLYAITDDSLLAEGRLIPAVTAALRGGCQWMQYRSKQHDASQRLHEAQQLLTLCREHGARLLINDDVALAHTIGADGVHLGQDDMSLVEARRMLGDKAIIGITCHDSLAAAHDAQIQGANYVAFGRFFPSNTKQSAPPADLSVLREAKKTLTLPLIAIGGITLDNASTVLSAGADMVAVVGDLWSASEITARARAYNDLFH